MSIRDSLKNIKNLTDIKILSGSVCVCVYICVCVYCHNYTFTQIWVLNCTSICTRPRPHIKLIENRRSHIVFSLTLEVSKQHSQKFKHLLSLIFCLKIPNF